MNLLRVDPAVQGANAPRPRVQITRGISATHAGLALRLLQGIVAVAAISVMAVTGDFQKVTAFRYFIASIGLQILWSLSMAVLDIYAMRKGFDLQGILMLTFFAIGDGVTSTFTLLAACGAGGIVVHFYHDVGSCQLNDCVQFGTATALAITCWVLAVPCFTSNHWALVCR